MGLALQERETKPAPVRLLSLFWAALLAKAVQYVKLPHSAAKLLSDLIEITYYDDSISADKSGAVGSKPRPGSRLAGEV